MMKRFFTFSLLALMCLCASAQDVTLTFTGRDADGRYVQLDRVVVTNQTKGWQETLFWPDTTLVMRKIATDMDKNSGLVLLQNTPNPFNNTTDVRLFVENAGKVSVTITDINGRIVIGTVETPYNDVSTKGVHLFRVSLAMPGAYVLTARQNGHVSSIKMVCEGGGNADKIEYQGVVETQNLAFPQTKNMVTNPFEPSDRMEYVGYANIDGKEMGDQRVMRAKSVSQTIPLLFVKEKERKKKSHTPKEAETENFRVALSLSPFSLNQFQEGYKFNVNGKTASTPEELQSIYREMGSTEMYVRVATKRHVTAENITDGEPDENANVHTFDQTIRLCQIAKALDIPINPEIMCAYTYMDMDKQQAPRFDEYPEFNYLMNGKKWEELTLDEICVVLETYGEFVAEAILSTGCTVNNWNLGNEANFGFAGISMGLKTAGISYYPSAPSMSVNKKALLKKTVKKINKKCGLNVFIGEFSYPSGKMDGPFAGWNKKVKGYKHDQQGQANIYADVVKWGKANGMAGIRYWAPDYEGWYSMSMFEFTNKVGTAKNILQNHKEIVEK